MNIFVPLSANILLSAHAVGGAIWLILLFTFCFLSVHAGRYVYVNRKPPQKKPEPAPETKEKAPAPQEPIYYIVERKQRRAKPKYTEPKEIRFK